MDFMVWKIYLIFTIAALWLSLVVGQLLDKKLLQQYFGKDRFRLFSGWYYLIKYAMPVVIILVLSCNYLVNIEASDTQVFVLLRCFFVWN